MKNITEINQSDTAKRKLKNISKNNNLPIDFVSTLYKFNWDLDPVRPGESMGWVNKKQYTEQQFNEGVNMICSYLKVDKNNIEILKKSMIPLLIEKLEKIDRKKLRENFLIAGENANKCYLSEFATTHYLNNYSKEKLYKLGKDNSLINSNNIENDNEKYTIEDFINYLFLKVFRAGSIERGSLFYCYTDLYFKLPYEKELTPKNNWIDLLIKNIEKQENIKLSDLIKCCKSVIKGDKHFKQTILEALSYSGDLKVKGIKISEIFIPYHKDNLASHFYSNEWTYPLRMWNENN